MPHEREIRDERSTERADAAARRASKPILPQPLSRARLERVDRLALPQAQFAATARWSRCATSAGIRLDDLKEIEPRRKRSSATRCSSCEGQPANNVLLTGARGTGKSSLIKACLNEYAPRACA